MDTSSEPIRCPTCLLPQDRVPGYRAESSCRLCRIAAADRSPRPDRRALAAELERRIGAIKRVSRNRRYDCLVGLSGGRDSTYLLYLLVKRHGLRCLAAYYRTPFTSDVTDANVRRTCDALGVTLVELSTISRDEHRRVARTMLLRWLENPSDSIVASMMCAPCKLVNRDLFRVARKHGVRAVVCGSNPYEAVQIAPAIGDDAAVATAKQLGLRKQVQRSLAIVRKGAGALANAPHLLSHLSLGVKAAVMYIHPHTPFLRLFYREIDALEYFYYAPWTQEDCERALAELGWQLPPGCRSTWKADCSFGEIKNYAFKQMTGMTYMDAFIANMVRAGAIDKDAAARRLEKEGVVSEERLREVCTTLGVPPGEFGLRS